MALIIRNKSMRPDAAETSKDKFYLITIPISFPTLSISFQTTNVESLLENLTPTTENGR